MEMLEAIGNAHYARINADVVEQKVAPRLVQFELQVGDDCNPAAARRWGTITAEITIPI